MTPFTVTLTYPAGSSQLAWIPEEPSDANPCHPGDTITFQSPGVKSIVTFGIDSPFEATKGPEGYAVEMGAKLTLTINDRVRSDPPAPPNNFVFSCSPNGIVVPGSGGNTPVGGGGNKT